MVIIVVLKPDLRIDSKQVLDYGSEGSNPGWLVSIYR
jgi:hypothetical protein